jgi:hypothetical protein
MTLIAESLHLLLRPAPYMHFPNALAHALTVAGALSFIVFIKACIQLTRLEVGDAT